MPAYSFAFGPANSFCLTTPLGYTSSGLSDGLRNALYNDPQARNRFVSIGADGKYFYSRINGQGDVWNGHVEDRVITWFDQRYAAGDGQFQFSYGPGNTWVACTSAGGYWSGGDISDTIELQTKDFWPVKATLGISGSYVLVDADGRRKWDLKGKYDNLDNILLNTTLGIEAVALNPYEEGQFFIRFQSGGWRAWLHASNLDEVSKAMNEAFEYEAQIMQMRRDRKSVV